MTSIKNRERILEAIDQLRRRKARPDIKRICGYLFRWFQVNSAEARSDLDWCVANNYVLKVEYKGNISYRNAAKKIAQMKQRGDPSRRTQQNNKIQQADNTLDNVKQMKQFGELLTNAFGELIVEEPDYLEMGIPSEEIIENILAKDSVRYTEKYIGLLIDKEVERGGLIKMENGNYLMGPVKNDEEPDRTEKERNNVWIKARNETEIYNRKVVVPEEQEGVNNRSDLYFTENKIKKKISEQNFFFKSSSFENMEGSVISADDKKFDNGSLRIGGRRKRAKKVFDPSDNHVPKKRGRPVGSLNRSTIEKQLAKMNSIEEARPDSRTSTSSRDQGGVCSVCHIQNKRGPNDRMVSCRECSNKAHLSCLNGDDNMMLKMYPDNTWQCPHCKTCVVCFETANSGHLTVCSVCADAYHAGCHEPRLSDKIRNGHKWICENCQMPDELKINEIQSNIGNTFSNKISIESHNPSPSNSVNSSPSNSPSSSPTPPRLSPQLIESRSNEFPDGGDQSDSTSDYDDNIDPSIPDATHWTADEVYQYFAQYFPEEAKIFKEQEIDGRSLLLLKRIDVLTNLNLKLGPALKIYRHVVKLQVRRDDPKLYWL